MRDQAYWERWLRQRPKALEESRASVKEWYREAGVEKGERRAFKAALKAMNPDGVQGKREKKPPRRGRPGGSSHRLRGIGRRPDKVDLLHHLPPIIPQGQRQVIEMLPEWSRGSTGNKAVTNEG